MQTSSIGNKNNTGGCRRTVQCSHFIHLAFLLFMLGAIFFLNTVLSLPGLRFADAQLSPDAPWTLWPVQLLFPHPTLPSFLTSSWGAFFLLLAAFLIIFLIYLLTLCVLPRSVTHRYILGSTLVLGLLYVLIPVVTSQDLFLYIGYARMQVIYHLNPLTTPPSAIHTDPIYPHIYWVNQPSLYGPLWIFLTAVLQWLAIVCGFPSLLSSVLLLRLFGLAMHLSSTQLLWMLSGQLQRLHSSTSPHARAQAVLTFAWNPLLLLEAAVNAHIDTTALFFVLLALWLLLRCKQKTSFVSPLASGGVAVLLALAACIKLNMALLVPGLILFLWTQPYRLRTIVTAGAAYVGTIIALYAPFWQHGTILAALYLNPSSSRDVNTLPEFLGDLYKSGARLLSFPPAVAASTTVETVLHLVSIGLFFAAYSLLCSRMRGSLHTPFHLMRWMALVWLLYCALGTPWFWPWYTVTFFGLFALIAPLEVDHTREQHFFHALSSPLAISLFTFSMLSIYGFFTRGPLTSFIPWLPGFHWAYLRGLVVWFLPLLALRLGSTIRGTSQKKPDRCP